MVKVGIWVGATFPAFRLNPGADSGWDPDPDSWVGELGHQVGPAQPKPTLPGTVLTSAPHGLAFYYGVQPHGTIL